ncbi:MAG: transglutaminase domain-containing protein [Clostridia bacterium]|nr:transglutaminase domain-containing protein [Clostridia bacterium]MBQ3955781.1 transglutaminase domain-containing protein [Clostridia bacterium]
MTKKRTIIRICAALAALLMLAGCSEPIPEDPATHLRDDELTEEEIPEEAVPMDAFFAQYNTPAAGVYQAPAMQLATFHADKAIGNNGAQLDLSMVSEGVVAAKGSSSNRLKFVIVVNNTSYYYNMKNDGTPSIFPLTFGSATYKFRIMENTTGSKYRELYSNSTWVQLSDQFAPYLRNSDYVPYSADSACVKKAAELAAQAADAVGVVSKVYEYVTANITYDYNKANTVQSGYMSNPDSTLSTGTGICFDYAALTAAMLRSQGIPAKMVFGYVGTNGAYHAWNMFYTAETGWVTVSFQAPKDSWSRLDLTFCAGGIDPAYIGNGTNYSDVYYY